jgi:hypothetical protein
MYLAANEKKILKRISKKLEEEMVSSPSSQNNHI